MDGIVACFCKMDLSHDMSPRDPRVADQEYNNKRDEQYKSKPTKRAISLGHQGEEQSKQFNNIVNGELGREFNLDGSTKEGPKYEKTLNEESSRRAVKSDARITNNAHQYSPEQIVKMREQNERRKAELREFKVQHQEAKARQELLEKEKEVKFLEDEKAKIIIGDIKEYRTQNGRKKPQDHVVQRSEKFDIILGQEVDKMSTENNRKNTQRSTEDKNAFKKVGEAQRPSSAQRQSTKQNVDNEFTDAEFKNLGIRSKSNSRQDSEVFENLESQKSQESTSTATSRTTTANPSRVASAQLPQLKNSSTQVSKPGTTTERNFKPSTTNSNQREFGRNQSQDLDDIAQMAKVLYKIM